MKIDEPTIINEGFYTKISGSNSDMFKGKDKIKQINDYIKAEFKKKYPNITVSMRVHNFKNIVVTIYVNEENILTQDDFFQLLCNDREYQRKWMPKFFSDLDLRNRVSCTLFYMKKKSEGGIDFKIEPYYDDLIPDIVADITDIYSKEVQYLLSSYDYDMPASLVNPKLEEAKKFLEKAYQSFNYQESDYYGDYSHSTFNYSIRYKYRPKRKK